MTPDRADTLANAIVFQAHRIVRDAGLRPQNNNHATSLHDAIRAYVAACVEHHALAAQAHDALDQQIQANNARLKSDHAWSPELREKVAQADAHALAARKEWDALLTPHAHPHPHRPAPVVSTADTPDPAGLVTGASVVGCTFTHTVAGCVNDDMAGADTYTGVLPTGCVIVPVEDEIDSLMDALAPAHPTDPDMPACGDWDCGQTKTCTCRPVGEVVIGAGDTEGWTVIKWDERCPPVGTKLYTPVFVTDDLDAATRGAEARLRMTVPVHGMAVALAEAQHQLRAVGDTIAQAHALLGRCAVALNHHPTSQALRADVNGWLRRNVP